MHLPVYQRSDLLYTCMVISQGFVRNFISLKEKNNKKNMYIMFSCSMDLNEGKKVTREKTQKKVKVLGRKKSQEKIFQLSSESLGPGLGTPNTHVLLLVPRRKKPCLWG